MTELHDRDIRATCMRCGKKFVLHSHTEGEERKFCFTCRVLLKASGELPLNLPHKSQALLMKELTVAKKAVPIDSMWTHYKNPDLHYKIVGHAILEATDEVAILYQAQYGTKLTFVRPLSNFMSKISLDGKKIARFIKVALPL